MYRFSYSLTLNGAGAYLRALVSQLFIGLGIGSGVNRTLMAYQSLREKGSTVFFLRPFLPLESLLFLQKYNRQRDCCFAWFAISV